MTRRTHRPTSATATAVQALAAAAAGTCLTLSACGTSSAPAGSSGSAGSAGTGASRASGAGGTASGSTGSAVLTGHFCRDSSTFMRQIPAGPSSRHTSMAQARSSLTVILRSTVRGFTELKSEAPHSLHRPLAKIIAVYRADERIVRHSSSLTQISQAMVKKNVTASSSFQRVLRYISVSCH
jgi:hypothetical protein